MHIHKVHSRLIAAPPDTVGNLLEDLSHDGGRVWPGERWPTTPLRFERGFEVGATGKQGSLSTIIEAHEPGRYVVFRFPPRSPLVGSHRLDVEPVGPASSCMTHIADFSVKRFLLPVVPVLLGYHNAIIEDMLARADHLATGTQLRYPRVPRWLRAVNALETGWWRWRGKLPPAEGRPGKRRRPVANVVAGALVPTLLLGLGTLHAAWGLGSSWPAADRDSLAHWVIGPGAVMPPDAACWTVAALLTLAAAGTSAAARGARSRHVPPIAWATAAALLARGLVYPPIDLASGLSSDRDRIDLAVYSPLCVLLGLGALFLARDLPSRRSARAAATA